MSAEARNNPVLGRIRQTAEALPTRIVVTLALLGVVASRIDWREMEDRLRHGHPLDFLAAVVLVLVALIVGAYRWWRLLRGADIKLNPTQLTRVYTVSTFSGTFLPTTLGSDVTRALLVVRRGPMLTRVATTIFVDRVGGLIGLLGMAWIAFAFQATTVPAGARVFLIWVTGVVIVGSLIGTTALFRGSRVGRVAIPRRMMPVARESRWLLREYARDPAILVMLVIFSLVYQALISLQLVMLARAIDVHLPFATAAVVLALVTIVTLIPISIGGFGVREGTYVVLLSGASIGATDATLISVLSVATLFLASLPGAFMLARSGLRPIMEVAPQ
jgi:glycosyltransferase 2 family protein